MAFFLLMVNLAWGASQLDVYKLIQYHSEGSFIGSHVSGLNFLGAHYSNREEIPRKVAVIGLSELTLSTWSEIVSHKPSGVLIIIDEKSPPHWRELESLLGGTAYQFPVYFTHKSAETQDMYASLKHLSSGTSDDQLQIVVSTDEKQPIAELEQENFYGFIHDYNENLPTLALVTYYDSFSIVPELATGANINASGVVVLLELARIFSNLFEKGLPGYNLLILATSAGTFNFKGLRHWLEVEDVDLQAVLTNVAFALCLDGLGKSDALSMHISRFHKEGETEAVSFYSAFNATATQSATKLGYIKKKVNMADPYIPWAHEQFARSKLVAATLSEVEAAPSAILDRGDLFDEAVNLGVLEKNIRFTAEALLKYLYRTEGSSLKLYNNQELTNSTIIAEWVEKVTNHTRFPTNLKPGSAFNKMIAQEIKALTASTFKAQKFKLTEFQLYPSRKELMSVYRVKPAILDFYIFLGVLAYIAALWGVLKLCGELGKKKAKQT